MTEHGPQTFMTGGHETEERECEWRFVDTNQYVGDILAYGHTYKIFLNVGREPVIKGGLRISHSDRITVTAGPLPLPGAVITLRKVPGAIILEVPLRIGTDIEEEVKLEMRKRLQMENRSLVVVVQQMLVLAVDSYVVVFSSDGRRKPLQPEVELPPGGGERYKIREPG